jgi:hypothetical protein
MLEIAPRSTQTEGMTYARTRLLLGISTVGFYVTLSVMLLVFTPYALGDQSGSGSGKSLTQHATMIASAIGIYVLLHVPADLLGGWILPRRYERTSISPPVYLSQLTRGVLVHSSCLFVLALTALLLTTLLGRFGYPLAAGFGVAILLFAKPMIAGLMYPLHKSKGAGNGLDSGEGGSGVFIDCDDPTFSGGILSVRSPLHQWFPQRWVDELTSEQVNTLITRRVIALRTGSVLRGRIGAILFVMLGSACSSMLVDANLVGSGAGVIEYALWFTLWSFFGLLTLPTLSRRGNHEVDHALLSSGVDEGSYRSALSRIDDLRESEPSRPALIESIFHPIPSVELRGSEAQNTPPLGFWDIARTSIYLGNSSLSLLGRAVHCNCGRPALWVMLPSD